MPDTLSSLLVDLIDSVEPVSAEEARSRATHARATRPLKGHRHGWMAVGGAVAAAAAAAGVVVGVSGSGSHGPFGPGPLSAQSVRLVADTSAAAMSSGTAHADIRDSFGGTTESNTYSIDMSFSGSDLSEQYKMMSTPPIVPGVPTPPPE